MPDSQKPSALIPALTPQTVVEEIDAPLSAVVQAIARLEKGERLMGASRSVSVIPQGSSYFFRIRTQRFGTMTTEMQGQVTPERDGTVTLSGTTRLNLFYMVMTAVLMFFMLLGIGALSRMTTFAVPFAIFLILSTALSFFPTLLFSMRDRRRLADDLSAALDALPPASVDTSRLAARDEDDGAAETGETARAAQIRR